ncbi:hypothetical protein DMH88_06945 [Escherichia coli]|nr:hypothetical protein [Escherichia coli]
MTNLRPARRMTHYLNPFSHTPDTARDFMEIHLPKDLRELYDLDSLNWNPPALSMKIAGATFRYSVVGKDP